jgi:glycosyltransferase involved in cell wall biosynthesis
MRILVVTPSLAVGGNERILVDLVRGLAARGHEIALVGASGALEAELDDLSLPRVVLRDRGRSPIGLAIATVRLAALARRWRPDVVHAFNPKMTAVADLARTGLRSRPALVATFGNSPAHERGRAARLLGRATLVCPESAEMGAQLTEAGLPPTQQRVIPPGVAEAPATTPSARAALDRELELGDGPTIVAVGRLVQQKNHRRLLDAIVRVRPQHPGVRVLVAGDGPLRLTLEEAVQRLDLGRHVTLLGQRGDVPALVARADLVVSASDWEGLSVAGLEALAAGTPLVTTPACGMRELLADGGGIVVDGFDATSLAEGIDDLLSDPARRVAMGAQARAVAARYSIAALVDAYEACYREASSISRR